MLVAADYNRKIGDGLSIPLDGTAAVTC